MPTGFGIPQLTDGTGTTPEDLQRITAAKYLTAGILGDGAEVQTQADWRYKITNGAVIIDTNPGMAVEVPVAEQYLTPDPAPSTGSRVDTIYAFQNMPDAAGNNLAGVAVTTAAKPTVPAGAIVLDKRTVPAGATKTSSTTSTYDRVYSVPTTGLMGMLGTKRDTDTTPHGSEKLTRGSHRFVLPTDRWVDIRMTSTVSRSDSKGVQLQGNLRASLTYRIYIDGTLRRSWEREYGRAWDSIQFTTTEYLTAGAHTVHYTVAREWADPGIYLPNDYWAVRYGGVDQHHGDAITTFDRGVAK